MSVLITSPAQIANHPLNTSKSKQQFSFPHSRRFSEAKKPYCNNAFYDLPEMKDGRKTSFGFGKKYDFTKVYGVSPPPNKYDIKGTFGQDKKRGFSFGSRPKTGPGIFAKKDDVPGPGQYNVNTSTITNKGVTITGKRKEIDHKDTIPGPGKYDIPSSINETGKYFYWKFKGSGAVKISQDRKSKGRIGSLFNIDTSIPGPGKYEVPEGLNKTGQYFLSKYSSSKSTTFGKSPKSKTNLTLDTPGPGSYLLPSEFGVYVSIKAPESSNAAKSKTFGSTPNIHNVSKAHDSSISRPKTAASIEHTPAKNRNKLSRSMMSTDSKTDIHSSHYNSTIEDSNKSTLLTDSKEDRSPVRQTAVKEEKMKEPLQAVKEQTKSEETERGNAPQPQGEKSEVQKQAPSQNPTEQKAEKVEEKPAEKVEEKKEEKVEEKTAEKVEEKKEEKLKDITEVKQAEAPTQKVEEKPEEKAPEAKCVEPETQDKKVQEPIETKAEEKTTETQQVKAEETQPETKPVENQEGAQS